MKCGKCGTECMPYRGMKSIAECPICHDLLTDKDGSSVSIVDIEVR